MGTIVAHRLNKTGPAELSVRGESCEGGGSAGVSAVTGQEFPVGGPAVLQPVSGSNSQVGMSGLASSSSPWAEAAVEDPVLPPGTRAARLGVGDRHRGDRRED